MSRNEGIYKLLDKWAEDEKAQAEMIKNLKGFARFVLEASWAHMNVDACDIEEKALEFGLIELRTDLDLNEHEYEEMYFFSDVLKEEGEGKDV